MALFEKNSLTENLNESSQHDRITGLYNVTAFLDKVVAELPSAGSASRSFFSMHLSEFSVVSQNYGFYETEQLLREIAIEIKKVFPDGLATRSNGDNFVMVCRLTDKNEIISRISDLGERVRRFERGLRLKLIVGIYIDNPEDNLKLSEKLDNARLACEFISKKEGHDYCFYTSGIENTIQKQRYVINNFADAIKNRYIKPYYQPQVRTISREICGYEALARWDDPERGLLSPGLFIPLLEDGRKIHEADLCIIEQVCETLGDMIKNGRTLVPVSVNLSRLDFYLCDIFEEVDRIRRDNEVPVDLLHIEITEGAIAQASEAMITGVQKFRETGYEIHMDDFGSGYSTLNNLRQDVFEVIKLDMNFIKRVVEDERSQVIMASMISMIKELGITTLSEGAETEEQYQFLLDTGCEIVQGYYFGKPAPTMLEDSDELHAETFASRDYYKTIGAVNILGTTPLLEKKMHIYNYMPITVIEIVGGSGLVDGHVNNRGALINFIYVNEAFGELLKELGVGSIEEANKLNDNPDYAGNLTILKLAAKAETTGNIEFADAVVNGNIISISLRFLGRKDDRSAFIAVTNNLNESTEIKRRNDTQSVIPYLLSLYFRVDLYDEDGSVENIYLDAKQGRITDEETDAKKAVRMYAERYIREDEREKFMEYYDMTTVPSRIKKSGLRYLTENFHSVNSKLDGCTQSYIIMPFYIGKRWKALSLCRNLVD